MNLEALRNKAERLIIGLMSGTSCDGVDAALVRISGSHLDTSLDLLDFRTFPYRPELRDRLLAGRMEAKEICLLDFILGEEMANAVVDLKEWAAEINLVPDFVASHGHTVAHYPPVNGGPSGGTLQIGQSAIIAERTGLGVVSDFRPRDMAAGGQGAPLVPFADWLLFGRGGSTTVCLNIGGIANITVATPAFEEIRAFDTGPGNMVIDGAARILSGGSLMMDLNGQGAAKGKVIDSLLAVLLDHPYFELPPPKSAGREQFGPEAYLMPLLDEWKGHTMADGLATVTLAVARTIADAVNRWVRPAHDPECMILSGGGAFNPTLVALLGKELPEMKIAKSEDYGIGSDAREAVAFAILGNETVFNQPGNVPGATGAEHPVVLGKITPGSFNP